jgi:hypothetical protein
MGSKAILPFASMSIARIVVRENLGGREEANPK